VAALSLVLSACGGGGGNSGGGGGNPKPVASISASPSTITLGQSVTLTWSCTNSTSASASGDWSGVKATNGSESVTPASTGVKNYTVNCTGSGGSASDSASVTVNAVPVPPTASVSPSSATVAFGDTKNFSCSTTGTPAPTVSWSTDIGTVSSAGVYTPPTSQPSQFLATVTCTATNSAGSASSSAQVNLVPKIVSVSRKGIYCLKECLVSVRVTATGIFPPATSWSSSPRNFIEAVASAGGNDWYVFLSFGTSRRDPGPLEIWTAEPGPGGGESNRVQLIFRDNSNNLAVSTELFGLDPAAGVVRKFTLGGASDGSFSVGSTRSIAADNEFVVLSNVTGARAYRVSNNSPASGVDASGGVMGVAIGGGRVCLAEDTADLVSCFDPHVINPAKASASAGDIPVSVAMAEVDGEWYLFSISYNDLVLRKIRLSDLNLSGSLNLTGLTPLSSIVGANGGMELAAFSSGPKVGTVAVFDGADQKIVFVDSRTMSELSRADLPAGEPLTVAADNTRGKLIVAVYDHSAGLTRLYSADPASGAVTDTGFTTDVVATGLAVSADGAKIYVQNRDRVAVINQ